MGDRGAGELPESRESMARWRDARADVPTGFGVTQTRAKGAVHASGEAERLTVSARAGMRGDVAPSNTGGGDDLQAFIVEEKKTAPPEQRRCAQAPAPPPVGPGSLVPGRSLRPSVPRGKKPQTGSLPGTRDGVSELWPWRSERMSCKYPTLFSGKSRTQDETCVSSLSSYRKSSPSSVA